MTVDYTKPIWQISTGEPATASKDFHDEWVVNFGVGKSWILDCDGTVCGFEMHGLHYAVTNTPPQSAIDQAKALIEAAGGTVTMPEPEIDYEACRAAYEEFYGEIIVPMNDGHKYGIRVLIAAAKLLPAEYRG